ncbi:restriction endonuclease [Microlunatus capsulatus]|uniref:Restriction system protein n=1 Tax=Microlunatus capsulatus TaxID=99117 RepID=A0ABS4Z489_9ACTN|nr:restriction endonuclease [Microlunatus capsulatus]MBP2415848.1 restriction system protein [Microlunatus capsulatus]
MTVPGFQQFMLPALQFLSDEQPHRGRDVIQEVADRLHLTEGDRDETIPSGQPVYVNRAHWAMSHMFQAGLITRPSRGVVIITESGRKALATNPGRIDVAFLGRYPSYQEFRSRKGTRTITRSGASPSEPADAAEETTPEDLMETAERENRANVESEVLARLHTLDPAAFERLVLKVLSAMGYGGRTGAVEHTGRSGDGGIDGIIRQDPLGLDRVYLQAKRYSPDNSVGRPALQAFVGALHGQKADRGVIITTSTFSRDAVEYVRLLRERIVLIDGQALATLMVLHNVGVQKQSTYVLKRMDEDYFESI